MSVPEVVFILFQVKIRDLILSRHSHQSKTNPLEIMYAKKQQCFTFTQEKFNAESV